MQKTLSVRQPLEVVSRFSALCRTLDVRQRVLLQAIMQRPLPVQLRTESTLISVVGLPVEQRHWWLADSTGTRIPIPKGATVGKWTRHGYDARQHLETQIELPPGVYTLGAGHLRQTIVADPRG